MREHNLEPGRPPCDWDDRADRDRLVSELVDDAYELIWAAEDLVDEGLELTEKQADAVALLALVAGQDVEPGDRPGQWRIARRVAKDRVVSTVDPESRHVHKSRSSYRDGFKGHVMAEPDTGLITGCELGAGNDTDAEVAIGLVDAEPDNIELLGDSAYGTGEFRAHLRGTGRDAIIKPPPLRRAVDGGFSLDDFTIDPDTATVTCPEGHTVTISDAGTARFRAHCAGCPVRHLCTRAKGGRTIKVHPHHALLATARAFAVTDEFDNTYRQHRPMIERTIAWLCRNYRRCRYRGIERNQLGWSHRCAAVNLTRLVNLGISYTGTGWAIT